MVLISSWFQIMANIKNLGNSLISQYFAKSKLRKKWKKNSFAQCFYSNWHKVRLFLTEKSQFDIFTKAMPQNPFFRKSQFFRWILMVRFHAKMCVCGLKIFLNQNMEENVKINIKKSFLKRGGFENWPLKNRRFSKICMFTGSFFWVLKIWVAPYTFLHSATYIF